jgi:hypothetical protein
MCPESSSRRWTEGPVSRDGEHCKLWYDPAKDESEASWLAVALVGPPSDGLPVVEFLVDGSDPQFDAAVARVIWDLDIILGERDPWRYAQYWTTTVGNCAYNDVHWGLVMPLEEGLRGFIASLGRFEGFDRRSFSVGELRADSNWPWGYAFGVYCFLVDGRVVYVGRAAGETVGERLANQLRSISDPAWARVVTSDENRVQVFLVDKAWTHMAAALECYLIANLKPEFNLRSV